MVSRLQKELRGLSRKDRDKLEAVLRKVKVGDIKGLDIKALTGFDNLFRVRVGRLRVIYYRNDAVFKLRRVTNRDDKTYKNL